MGMHVELLTSVAVLILTISTIAVFIVYGYSNISYALLAVALVLAFTNLWLLRRERPASPPKGRTAARRGNRKRRK